MRRDQGFEVADDLFRRHGLCKQVDKVGPIAKQHQATVAECRLEVHAEVPGVRFYVVGATVHEHRHRFAPPEAGVSEVQCDRALAAAGAAGQ